MPSDTSIVRLLYAIISQKCLKDVSVQVPHIHNAAPQFTIHATTYQHFCSGRSKIATCLCTNNNVELSIVLYMYLLLDCIVLCCEPVLIFELDDS